MSVLLGCGILLFERLVGVGGRDVIAARFE